MIVWEVRGINLDSSGALEDRFYLNEFRKLYARTQGKRMGPKRLCIRLHDGLCEKYQELLKKLAAKFLMSGHDASSRRVGSIRNNLNKTIYLSFRLM